jgi:CBS domain-containing protein
MDMQTLHVANAMNPNVISISEEASLSDAIELLRQNRISALVVVDHSGHMVGVISQTDLLRAWKESGASPNVMHSAVNQYMTRDVVSVAPHKTLDYAMRTLNEHHIHRLVVVETHDGGRFVTDRMMPVGILSQTDIVRALIGKFDMAEATTSTAQS